MSIFKTELQRIDEHTKFGFELAIRYAELAKKYDKDIIDYLKEQLREWEA